jgi:hypothetical protein
MRPAGFEPTIPATERPQTHGLDRAATGIDQVFYGGTIFIIIAHFVNWGTRWRSWLRHFARNRKVAGSIPDGVIGIFIDIILSVALWSWGRLSL